VRSTWSAAIQHAAPVSALLVRGLQRCEQRDDTRLSRVMVDLLGPVPAEGDMWVRTQRERSGKQIELVTAELLAPGPDGAPRQVARASGWRLQTLDTADVALASAPPLPPLAEAKSRDMKKDWEPNYVHSLDWRWLTTPLNDGPGESWIRPEVDLVTGETMTPVERLFAVADCANGIGSKLNTRRWTFLNTISSCTCIASLTASGSASAPRPTTGQTASARRSARCSTNAARSVVFSSRCWCAAAPLVHQSQSRCGALCYSLLHPLAVGLRSVVLSDQHDAVVLHLEHVIGDRFANSVPRALVEVDFDPHESLLLNERRNAF